MGDSCDELSPCVCAIPEIKTAQNNAKLGEKKE